MSYGRTGEQRMKDNRQKSTQSSIARRINRGFVGSKLGAFFWTDFLGGVMAVVLWCLCQELEFFGEFRWGPGMRWFECQGKFWEIMYYVRPEGRAEVCFDGTMFFAVLFIALLFAVSMQGLSLLHDCFFGARRIREKLSPLNELAKRAEEFSSMVHDESKFQILEDAISNVNPGSGEEHLKIGDKDLRGLELAVNHLIDRMKESYRQQSRFVSDASHELRTPISVIQGYANMLDRWGKEDETVLEEGIAAIKHESEHMSTLVEQLLFLARSDSGRQKLEQEEVSLKLLMKEVYEESMMIDREHAYQFRDMSEGPVCLLGDMTMLKQTMRILAENARKYTRENDEIIFAVGQKEKECFFYVQDTGIGMLEKEVSHIFERFYRSEEARGSDIGGSGLGLSIAKWIVDKHRGHFEILSREGLGTRITVWLPLA